MEEVGMALKVEMVDHVKVLVVAEVRVIFDVVHQETMDQMVDQETTLAMITTVVSEVILEEAMSSTVEANLDKIDHERMNLMAILKTIALANITTDLVVIVHTLTIVIPEIIAAINLIMAAHDMTTMMMIDLVSRIAMCQNKMPINLVEIVVL